MKLKLRSIHKDFAYFYIGLIIAFSVSGIILNHRQDWYPMDYTYEQRDVELTIPTEISQLDTKEYILDQTKTWEIGSDYDGHRIGNEKLRIYFKDNIIADLDVKTGKGTVEFKRKVPVIGHTMYLHKSTDKLWIWYSDIFGVAMLVIAFTGLFIPVSKNGFKSRGWKLAVLGLIFPFIFLFILS